MSDQGNNLTEALLVSSNYLPESRNYVYDLLKTFKFYNITNRKIAWIYSVFAVIMFLSFISSVIASLNDKLQHLLHMSQGYFPFAITLMIVLLALPHLMSSYFEENSYFTHLVLHVFIVLHIYVVNYINMIVENNSLILVIILLIISLGVLLIKLSKSQYDVGIYIRDVAYSNFICALFCMILYPFVFSFACAASILCFCSYLIIQTKFRMHIYISKQVSLASKVFRIYSDVLYIFYLSVNYLINRGDQII